MKSVDRVGKPAAAGAVALAAAVLLAGCGVLGQQPPRLVFNDGWAASAIPDRRAGDPFSMVGAMSVCLDRAGSIRVVGVDLEERDGGLRIDAFALRSTADPGPQPASETHTETLAELGVRTGPDDVTTVCPDPADPDGHVTKLDLQFSKPSDRTARGAIIRVVYETGGEIMVHRMGFEMILCEGAQTTPECEARDYDWP